MLHVEPNHHVLPREGCAYIYGDMCVYTHYTSRWVGDRWHWEEEVWKCLTALISAVPPSLRGTLKWSFPFTGHLRFLEYKER